MTRSHCAWLAALALASVLAALPVLAAHHEKAEQGKDERVVEMISAKVGGKNIFVPGTVVVEAGKPSVISIVNTTEMPHGFEIPAAKIQLVLTEQEETRIEVPALDEGIYEIRCHLHPPHRSATLLVVD